MDRGKVIIIPNDDIEDEYFEQKIEMNHLEGFRGFDDKYNLGYEFEDEAYQEVPLRLAKDGHLVIKTVDDMGLALFYVPDVITQRQLDWVRRNINDFMFIESMGGFAIRENSISMPDKLHGFYEVTETIKKRSKLYEKQGKKM